MSSIFLSYSRKNEPFARKLARALSDLGLDVWLDVEDIPAGMKWSSAIQQGLDTANLLIVVITPASMESTNVEDEWQYYLDNKKPVIPVLLEPAKIHFQLARIQYIDFHTQGFDVAFAQLITELNRKGIAVNLPQPEPQPITPQPQPIKPPEPYEYFNRERAASVMQPGDSPVMPDVKKSAPPPQPTPFHPNLSGNTPADNAPKTDTMRYLLIGGAVLVVVVALLLIVPSLLGAGGNPCPGLPDSQFKTGDTLRIIGDAQTLFSTHEFDSRAVATVPRTVQIVIFGAPVCGQNSIWWPVTVGSAQGWMAENFNDQRLLQKWES